jgi:hypothetical protein
VNISDQSSLSAAGGAQSFKFDTAVMAAQSMPVIAAGKVAQQPNIRPVEWGDAPGLAYVQAHGMYEGYQNSMDKPRLDYLISDKGQQELTENWQKFMSPGSYFEKNHGVMRVSHGENDAVNGYGIVYPKPAASEQDTIDASGLKKPALLSVATAHPNENSVKGRLLGAMEDAAKQTGNDGLMRLIMPGSRPEDVKFSTDHGFVDTGNTVTKGEPGVSKDKNYSYMVYAKPFAADKSESTRSTPVLSPAKPDDYKSMAKMMAEVQPVLYKDALPKEYLDNLSTPEAQQEIAKNFGRFGEMIEGRDDVGFNVSKDSEGNASAYSNYWPGLNDDLGLPAMREMIDMGKQFGLEKGTIIGAFAASPDNVADKNAHLAKIEGDAHDVKSDGLIYERLQGTHSDDIQYLLENGFEKTGETVMRGYPGPMTGIKDRQFTADVYLKKLGTEQKTDAAS